MNNNHPFTNMQIDVLKEIGNIGAGNAATSFSKMINRKVDMKVPSVKIIPFAEVMDLLGGAETPVAALMIQIEGEVSGKFYFILSIEQAELLIKKVSQQDIKLLDNSDEVAISALKETANILTGSYIAALSDFTNLMLAPSVPHLSVDMAGAVLSTGLIDISMVSDYAIIIDTEITDSGAENGIKGHFFFLPDLESFPELFSSLGIQSNE